MEKLKFTGNNHNDVSEFLPEQWSNTAITTKDGKKHVLQPGDTIVKDEDGNLSIEED